MFAKKISSSPTGIFRNYTELAVLALTIYVKQECIPGECVPSAAVAVSRGGGGLLFGGYLLLGVSASGGCLLLGVSALEGCLLLGECLLLGGVYSWGVSASGEECLLLGRDVCFWGVSALVGCLLLGGVGVVSQNALRQTPPPLRGQTDACKIITFATSLRTVNISAKSC